MEHCNMEKMPDWLTDWLGLYTASAILKLFAVIPETEIQIMFK